MASNTAVRVYGTERLDRRLRQIQLRLVDRARPDQVLLTGAVRILTAQVVRRIPVITGRLYRSLRIVSQRGGFSVVLQAPYALWPELRSKRNARYFIRGLTAGVQQANRWLARRDQGPLRIRFRRGSIRRWGSKAAMQCRIDFEFRQNPNWRGA